MEKFIIEAISCEVMKLADIPSCLGGEDHRINVAYLGLTTARAIVP